MCIYICAYTYIYIGEKERSLPRTPVLLEQLIAHARRNASRSQCVQVCCSVLQCVAVCCSVLQYVAA